jgi:phosphoglycerate dehydrogenase-like enzyme
MKPRVLIGPAPMRNIPHTYAPLLEGAFELVYPKRVAQLTEAELLEQLPGCVASLAGSEPYTRKVIEAAGKAGLKVLARAGVGYDAVDVQACTENGIAVTNAPGTNHEAVAEHALMLMLALSKSLLLQHEQMRAGGWPRIAQLPMRGRTLGVIGLGRTGSAVALRAKAFGMPVIACDPYVDGVMAKSHGIALHSLKEVLEASDIVSLHVPLMPETKAMINAETLGWMKPTAHLINTARGEVIDEAALYEALKSKRIAAAGLDVFVDEPPKGSPLLTLDNVILTAHTAGVDLRSREDMAHVGALGIAKLLIEHVWPVEYVVNPDVRSVFPHLRDWKGPSS